MKKTLFFSRHKSQTLHCQQKLINTQSLQKQPVIDRFNFSKYAKNMIISGEDVSLLQDYCP